MRTLRKYTGILAKIHGFALIFSFLFSYATPQLSKAFAQETDDGIKVLRASKTPEAIEGEFIVQFKTDKSLKLLDKGEKPKWMGKLGKGINVDISLRQFKIAHIKVANPAGSGQWENLANILSSDPDVSYVEPNYLSYALKTPNDSMVSDMWFLKNIQAYKAWDVPADGKDVLVAVIDSGIQFNHEDLRGRIWINKKEKPDNGVDDDHNGFVDDIVGWNFHEANNMPYSKLYPAAHSVADGNGGYDCTGHPTKKAYEIHGSHVSGTIAAMNDNHKGITGIANRIKIMPLKALGGACGYGGFGILKAVIYAVNNGARIINMSLGGYRRTKAADFIYKQASKAGVLIVAAAGNEANDNDSKDKSYPASYPYDGILSVAATGPDDALTDFSNFGEKNVDIGAPGINILSTIPTGTGDTPVSGYRFLPGTSMAAPVVTGAAALLLAQRPNLTNIQLKNILMSSVDKIPALAGKIASGGRLNIYKALKQQSVVAAKQPPVKDKPTERSSARSNSVGGIRIFDTRENKQKW